MSKPEHTAKSSTQVNLLRVVARTGDGGGGQQVEHELEVETATTSSLLLASRWRLGTTAGGVSVVVAHGVERTTEGSKPPNAGYTHARMLTARLR